MTKEKKRVEEKIVASGEEPAQAEVNIGMIGHVDHGKTTLVEKLTGTWTDTHSEELKRGISIRLGYADTIFRKCPNCAEESYTTEKSCAKCGTPTVISRKVSFVDAPGHETLMATMLSGAALMNGAVLVVAANESCPQPRTAEHLMALSLSETQKIVVAQNKVDLVDKDRAKKSHEEIEKFLKDYGYEGSTIIPIAANFGSNLDLLIQAIEENIPTPPKDRESPLKLFVARSFDINKPGTQPEKLQGGVLGGSIIRGTASIGQEIEISPGIDEKKLKTVIISLSTSKNRLQQAEPGGLVAIGTTLDPGLTRSDQLRGQVIAVPGSVPAPVKRLVLEVHLLKRLIGEPPAELKTNEGVVLTVGTATAVGTIVGQKKKSVEIALKNSVIIEPNQKVAISKRENARWRLVAYGVNA